MNRLRILFSLLVLAFACLPAQAVEPTLGVFDMARYIPSNADAFLAVRTDDEFLDTLDVLLSKVSAVLADVGADIVDVPSVRRGLAASFEAPSVEMIEDVLAWSADRVAVAVTQRPTQQNPGVLVVMPLDDIAGATAYVEKNFAPNATLMGTIGRFTVYDGAGSGYLLLADDLLMLAFNINRVELAAIAAESFPRLSDIAEYVAAVGALPADAYNVGAYVSASAFETTVVAESTIGVSFAAGATILGGLTYTLDISAVSAEPVMPPLSINPEFARTIPGTMGAAVHGADLAALINTAFTFVQQTSGDDARGIVTGALALAGIDINDFFSWTKGDFALFGRLDMRSILPSLLGTPPNLRGLPRVIDVALVIEAVNPGRAQSFAGTLATLLRAASAQGMEGASVSDETINGTTVTVLIFDSTLPSGATVTVEFAFGASDEVFAFGTANAVRAVFNGGASVLDSASYADAALYWLPQPFTVWTLDGLTAANIGALGYLISVPVGPSNPAPLPDQLNTIIERVGRFIRHATLSSTVNDSGIALLRGTITLDE